MLIFFVSLSDVPRKKRISGIGAATILWPLGKAEQLLPNPVAPLVNIRY